MKRNSWATSMPQNRLSSILLNWSSLLSRKNEAANNFNYGSKESNAFTAAPFSEIKNPAEVVNFHQIIGREIWKHENIKGWINHELHEDVAQVLVAAKNHLQATQIDSIIAPSHLKEASRILDEALKKIKQICDRLDVPPIQLIGLKDSLQQQISKENKNGSTKIQLLIHTDEIEKLDEPIKLSIYRILMEKLSNIRKHAKANNACIDLTVNAYELLLSVKDNGIGFYNVEAQWKDGLRMINTIIKNLGGKMELKTAPGRGCEFTAFLPIKSSIYYSSKGDDTNHRFTANHHP